MSVFAPGGTLLRQHNFNNVSELRLKYWRHLILSPSHSYANVTRAHKSRFKKCVKQLVVVSEHSA
jgi:hypothetical protein